MNDEASKTSDTQGEPSSGSASGQTQEPTTQVGPADGPPPLTLVQEGLRDVPSTKPQTPVNAPLLAQVQEMIKNQTTEAKTSVKSEPQEK